MTRHTVVRWVGWTIGVAAFALVARHTDFVAAVPVLRAAGLAIVLAAVPYACQIGLDALAWRVLLAGLGHRLAWRRLFTIRLATEAVLLTMPGGSVVGESLKPYLVHRTAAVPIADTVASVGIKRALLAFAQGCYLALAAIAGHDVLARNSDAILGFSELPYLVAAAAATLAVVAVVLGLVLTRGRVAAVVRRLLAKLPSARLRAALERREAGFAAADQGFERLGRDGRTLALATFLLLAAWFVETGEAWLICRLVGIDLPLSSVLAMEASVVFVRNLAFFLPAGLGVQDAGYLAFLGAYGVAVPLAAAFTLVKRLKELVWIAVGYLVMVSFDKRPTIVALGGLG